MRTYDYLEAQRDFTSLLDTALTQDVMVKQRDGQRFRIISIKENASKSPFEVAGINTDITTDEIVEIIRQSRAIA
ncbi:MAG: hypothetical protein LBN23_03200 [Paludibacter sp.]|jgi:hypothetical protein|nr:hypothetical protein [Paludibacter sp.]